VHAHGEGVEKGRQSIETIFHRIVEQLGVTVQKPGWEDKKRNQPDPRTNYIFTFGVYGSPKDIGFSVTELTDCAMDKTTHRQIEAKIRNELR